jgi:hypothetical protein
MSHYLFSFATFSFAAKSAGMILRRINPKALHAAQQLHMDETVRWLKYLSLDHSLREKRGVMHQLYTKHLRCGIASGGNYAWNRKTTLQDMVACMQCYNSNSSECFHPMHTG